MFFLFYILVYRLSPQLLPLLYLLAYLLSSIADPFRVRSESGYCDGVDIDKFLHKGLDDVLNDGGHLVLHKLALEVQDSGL